MTHPSHFDQRLSRPTRQYTTNRRPDQPSSGSMLVPHEDLALTVKPNLGCHAEHTGLPDETTARNKFRADCVKCPRKVTNPQDDLSCRVALMVPKKHFLDDVMLSSEAPTLRPARSRHALGVPTKPPDGIGVVDLSRDVRLGRLVALESLPTFTDVGGRAMRR